MKKMLIILILWRLRWMSLIQELCGLFVDLRSKITKKHHVSQGVENRETG